MRSPLAAWLGIARCALVVLSLTVALRAAAQELTPAEHLAEVEALYKTGDFDAAADRVNAMLRDEATFSGPDRARLYLMKARVELAFDRKDDLSLWLGKAHDADPSLTPDPVLDPPQIHAAWEDVKQLGAKTAAPAAPPPEASPEAPENPRAMLAAQQGTRDQRLLSRTLSIFPFGVAQAKNEQLGKAFAVATLHTALLAVAALTDNEVVRRNAEVAFAATWAASAYDGLKNDGRGLSVRLAPQVSEAHKLGVGLQLSWVPLEERKGSGGR
jgi:hypothetical protein